MSTSRGAPGNGSGLRHAAERFRARATDLREQLLTSYWFVPALLVCGAILAAHLAVALDHHTSSEWIRSLPGLHGTEPPGARALLGTIASSAITVASVVFSITIVALTVATAQFGSRLLRSFMAQRGTQVALGTFLATFVYELSVMREVRGAGSDFVPELALAGAGLLTLLSLGVLIWFLHQVATSLQVSSVAARVVEDVSAQLDRCFPPRAEPPAGAAPGSLLADFPGGGVCVRAPESGYVRVLDTELLVELAAERDLGVAIRRGPGRFAARGSVLAEVAPAEAADDEVQATVRDAFALGSQRTPIQDVAFSLNQLVEVAVRALSPGIHDPATAVTCLHRLGDAFSRIAQRPDPLPVLCDDLGVPRIWAHTLPLGELLRDALDRVLAHAGSHRDVWIAALDALTLLLETTDAEGRRREIGAYARTVVERAKPALAWEEDQPRLARAARALSPHTRDAG